MTLTINNVPLNACIKIELFGILPYLEGLKGSPDGLSADSSKIPYFIIKLYQQYLKINIGFLLLVENAYATNYDDESDVAGSHNPKTSMLF